MSSPHSSIIIHILTAAICSSDSYTFIKPCTQTNFVERAFSFAGPAVWNAVPAELRSIKSKLQRHFQVTS